MVSINAAQITHVKLMGAMSSNSRKLELYLTNGSVVGMSFDDPSHAEGVFATVIDTINRTIPDHVSNTRIVVRGSNGISLTSRYEPRRKGSI